MSNSLDPDQPDAGPYCLQRLSAEDTTRQRVNTKGLQKKLKCNSKYCFRLYQCFACAELFF